MPTTFNKQLPEVSGESPEAEPSSGSEEWQPTAAKACQQLDLGPYPEANKKLEQLESFYTMGQNLRRKGTALKLETWRKLKIHILNK